MRPFYGLHIFEPGLAEGEAPGLSMHPRGSNFRCLRLTRRGFSNATDRGRVSHSQRGRMKRDLYAEVSARIIAELEAGAAPWIKPWSATPGANTPGNAVTNRPYSGCNVVLLWMAQAAGYRTPRFLTFKQALELGGHVRKGERGTKVYFVKQSQIPEDAEDVASPRLVPLMREYTVFNVDQCEDLPDASRRASRCALAILMPATALPINSCAQLALTSARTRRGVLPPETGFHFNARVRGLQGRGSFYGDLRHAGYIASHMRRSSTLTR
jgi:hypothetical protein